jgi:serine/threonine protein kinase
MECNLYELISKKNVSITEMKAKEYFYQICKGMEYMHRLVSLLATNDSKSNNHFFPSNSKGIFHRDIKPEVRFTGSNLGLGIRAKL